AGVATFTNLTFAPQGTYTLVAYDGTLATITSPDFVVGPQALHLAWQAQPTNNVVAGSVLPSFSVRVNDINKNLVASDHSSVTLKIASGPTGATLGGTTTVTVINGIATFSDIVLTKSGAYKFAVTDGSLTGSTSNSFTIVPDLALINAPTGESFTTLILSNT